MHPKCKVSIESYSISFKPIRKSVFRMMYSMSPYVYRNILHRWHYGGAYKGIFLVGNVQVKRFGEFSSETLGPADIYFGPRFLRFLKKVS